MIELTAEQVQNGEYKQYDPERYDFRWSTDFSTVTVIPLSWWDDASYARYQGDQYGEDYDI